VFIAHDFESKGGPICVDVYRQLKDRIPGLRLVIIGGGPSSSLIENERGIVWLGTLRKDRPDEAARYRETLRNAFLLIHPSMADLGSAAILEAAYFGCPAVAPNRLCYVDQVEDGVSGVLIDPPLRSEDFVSAVFRLATDENEYARMRANARRRALDDFTWGSVAERMLATMTTRLDAASSGHGSMQGKKIT
jgi:glycosyltransferase involved in cell wall biosynthesis